MQPKYNFILHLLLIKHGYTSYILQNSQISSKNNESKIFHTLVHNLTQTEIVIMFTKIAYNFTMFTK